MRSAFKGGLVTEEVLRKLADRGVNVAVPGAVGLAALASAPDAEANKLRAFHGSPFRFDRFRMDRMGTGEGAQAYGPGLYFAQREGTAKNYKNILSEERAVFDHADLGQMDFATARSYLQEELQKLGYSEYYAEWAADQVGVGLLESGCLLYTSPSPRDG